MKASFGTCRRHRLALLAVVLLAAFAGMACNRQTTVRDGATCPGIDDLKCSDKGFDTLTACLDECPGVCPGGDPCESECKTACRGKFRNGPASCVVACGDTCANDQACLSACFDGCAGKPPADVTAPHTRIEAGPAGGSDAGGVLKFSCNEAACTFGCKLDAGAWFACESPVAIGPLADGPHVAYVRAYDAALNYDPDPAEWRWTVDTFVPVTPPAPPVPLYPVKPTWQNGCYNESAAAACPAPGDALYGQDAQYGASTTGFTVFAAAVTDTVTGLTWQRSDDGVARAWQIAANYCDGLTLAGFDDWRLPSSNELMGIVDYGRASPAIDGAVFPNTKPSFYWAAQSAGLYAWAVLFSYGYEFSLDKTITTPFVRCVR